MTQAKYNFENPETRSLATYRSRAAARPKTYFSKRKQLAQAKVEIFKDLLTQEGYKDALRPHMPRITKALIDSASKPTAAGTADRRLIFQIVGLIGKDQQKDNMPTMGQILEKIFANADPNDY